MEKTSTWAKLRAGEKQQDSGLKQLQLAYQQQPYPSEAMELGVALLWLRKYDLAASHFGSIIANNPKCGDNDYGMAGVANWCLGKPTEAVKLWKAGLKAKYARASGLGICMPLLLFLASKLQPEAMDEGIAKKLITDKTADIRIKNWPGPIAKWLIGQITEDELVGYCKSLGPNQINDSLWLVAIYKNLVAFHMRSFSGTKASLKTLTNTETPDWENENTLLTRIWNEEFFLARFLVEDLPSRGQ